MKRRTSSSIVLVPIESAKIFPCVDDALNILPVAMGIPVEQLSRVLQRCGDRVSSPKTVVFLRPALSHMSL